MPNKDLSGIRGQGFLVYNVKIYNTWGYF